MTGITVAFEVLPTPPPNFVLATVSLRTPMYIPAVTALGHVHAQIHGTVKY